MIRSGAREKELSGGEPLTTNNRMELLAAIRALEALKRPCEVVLHTDSIYVRDGITKWIHGWRRNGWKTADRKPVKNAELWQELLDAAAPHKIDWRWVKGHAGHPENERADRLACDAALQFAKRERPNKAPDRAPAPASRQQGSAAEPRRGRRGLDAEAALAGAPEEARHRRIEAVDRPPVGSEAAQARPAVARPARPSSRPTCSSRSMAMATSSSSGAQSQGSQGVSSCGLSHSRPPASGLK